MKVIALVSGGKDSCFNMMQCVAAGHEIVGLANLQPAVNDEIDSYMYQTVGHDGIDLYSDALGLPLFRRKIEGNAIVQQKDYSPTEGDEVEDLYRLLIDIKEQIDFDAIAVGAILSDYQRIRVENVCTRLGCVCLAYLWRRDQSELLQEMIECGINAIIIKTASLGLDPDLHLGQTISEMKQHLTKSKKKYGINVCGEGGEYETFTLDCPLFQQAIVLDEYEKVIHSNDAFAPVGYLKLNRMHLVKKTAPVHKSETESLATTPTESETETVNESLNDESSIMESVLPASTRQKNMLSGLKIKTPLDYLSDLVECHIADCCDGHMELCSQNHGQKDEDEDEEDENKCRTSNESIICNHRITTTLKSSISSSSIPLSLASDSSLPPSTATPTTKPEDREKIKEPSGNPVDLNYIENQMSSVNIGPNDTTLPSPSSTATTPTLANCPCQKNQSKIDREKVQFPVSLRVTSNESGWHWIMGIHDKVLLTNNKRSRRDDGLSLQNNIDNSSNSSSSSNVSEPSNPMKNALNSLLHVLEERNLRVSDLVGVVIYVSDMSEYAQYNKEYLKVFSSRPPVRICVEAPLPPTIPVLLEALAFRNPNQNQSSLLENNNDNNPTRQCMHVQGISHWAPANIGPYSQAVWVGDIIYVAGQIGLVPGSMQLVEGGARIECKLALRHISRVIKAVDSKVEMRDVVQGICYVTDAKFIEECRREWEKRTNNAIVEYLVVPRLPRDAKVEWQVWIHRHNTAFEYEETGCYIGTDVKVRMIRRWNYECRVAVIVCTASICTPGSGSSRSRFGRSEMIEMTEYALNKLNQESDEKSQNECAIRVFYRIGTLNPSDLEEVLGHQSTKYNVAFSIIPVSFLVKDNAVISFCGVRHQ